MGEATRSREHLEREVQRLDRTVRFLAGEMLRLIQDREDKCDFQNVLRVHDGLPLEEEPT